ncbi:threonine dehydratase [Antricoccus suffuscus]|uniref:Threonine dehydratase n=1 Tax=Antricoccus suffuscus TaxID=1629062 RepID=A0A2T1A687_9ACTN|nr:serine/threonine dehydratase [Antricoccus suffuscus]PRZ44110.1 threonine dehydratase [Antricoccus suffuscus]
MDLPELSAAVAEARRRIGGRVRRTPVVDAVVPTPAGPREVTFKLEYLQHSGSFKARGSINAVLAASEQGLIGESGIAIASGGNAGIAAAWSAAQVGCPASVFVPENAPAAKIARLRSLGADVVLKGKEYAEALHAAEEFVRRSGALQLHAYDLPDVVAGAGVVGLELLEQRPDIDTVLVAVGGGGLVAGIASAVTPRHVVGVEPSGIPTLADALAAGAPVDVPVDSIAADALGARRLGEIAYAVTTQAKVQSVLIPDAEIVRARAWLWGELRVAVEYAAATALAPLLSGAFVPAEGARVAVILCGANTDPSDLS